MPLFKPGSRTYILSGLALLCALILQAESQGVLELAPLLKITLTFALTVILPLVPVFIRKAIAQMRSESEAVPNKQSAR